MDSFRKPYLLSFDGNTSENWKRFNSFYWTASDSEKKDDSIKITILLNFAGKATGHRAVLFSTKRQNISSYRYTCI